MDPISNCIFHPNMIHFCWSPIRKHCWTTFEKVCQYWIFWLWTPKLKELYSLSFVDLLWFCGQMPAQHGRLDILTQNVIRSCHSKKNLPCTRHIVIKRVNSEKYLREKLGGSEYISTLFICAICLTLNVAKEYYDIVLLRLWDSKCISE